MKIKNASENTDAGATIAAVPLCFIKTLRSENSEAAYTALQDNGCLRCAYFARIAFNTQLAKGIWGNDSRPSHTDRRLSVRFCVPYLFLLKRFYLEYATIIARAKRFVNTFLR